MQKRLPNLILYNYIKNNNLEQIYDKNKASTLNEGIQYSNISSASNNNILPTKENVNDTTNYSKRELCGVNIFM